MTEGASGRLWGHRLESGVSSNRSDPDEVRACRPGVEFIPQPTTIWTHGTTARRSSERSGLGLCKCVTGTGFYEPEWVDSVFWRAPPANSGVILPQFHALASMS